MMTRIARCNCGAPRGGDWRAAACGHLSLHGVPTAYRLGLRRRRLFPEGAGAHRRAEQGLHAPHRLGRKVEFHFCPECGTSVFWYAEFRPDHVGIAFGAFADTSMPWPTVSVWKTTRHPWMTFDHPVERFGDQGLTPAGERSAVSPR